MLGVVELILRGKNGVHQSLHRFRDTDGTEYDVPVLIRLPRGLPATDGSVVEIGFGTERAGGEHVSVVVKTVQLRESSKNANFIWAAMDVVSSGLDVQTLMRVENPILVHICIRGPLRSMKASFLRSLQLQRTILEIGGGRGGDAGMWVHSGVSGVDVVGLRGGWVNDGPPRVSNPTRTRSPNTSTV